MKVQKYSRCLIVGGEVVYDKNKYPGTGKPKKEKKIRVRPKKVRKPRFSQLHPHLYDRVLLKQLKEQLISIYGEKCMRWGSTERIILEHIKSRRYGGTNDIENLQLLCSDCNLHKGHNQTDYRPK